MKNKSVILSALIIVELTVVGMGSLRARAIDIWGKDEVPRITNPKDVPQTLPEMWKGYNESYDKNNPLEAKIFKTWETQDGFVVNWVELTVGTFQGKKSIVCRFWAYPKDAKNLPAILFVNGGPQTGSEDSALFYARLGYACFNPNLNQDEKMGGETEGLPNTDWGDCGPISRQEGGTCFRHGREGAAIGAQGTNLQWLRAGRNGRKICFCRR